MTPSRLALSSFLNALVRSLAKPLAVTLALLFALFAEPPAPALRLPNKTGSVKFAVFGDTGTGGRQQYEIAERAVEYRRLFPFTFALLLGDNLYGSKTPQDFKRKFELPYRHLLADHVKFYAALGNHDIQAEIEYKLFNMGGKRYYTFQEGGIRFFALDTTYMDQTQIQWLEKELSDSSSPVKICFFHHPLYSSARRHGGDEQLKAVLEPLFVRAGVRVVFSGHDHTYERMKPQKGIAYWVVGSSAKLRKANIRPAEQTEKAFDRDNAFMLVEVADTLSFQTISRAGETVDSGSIPLKH